MLAVWLLLPQNASSAGTQVEGIGETLAEFGDRRYYESMQQIEQTIREYLPQIVHMSLGTSKDNKPWVCEVHFAYDEGLNLYFRSLASSRHCQEIATNPNVAGNIVKQHQLGETPRGVYFEGTAKLLEPGDEQNQASACYQDRLHASDDILAEAQRPDGRQFYKITVDTWYVFGKLDDQGFKKHELKWNRGAE